MACSNPACGFPATPCARAAEFFDPEADCPDLHAGSSVDVSDFFAELGDAPIEGDARDVGRFWTGLALGSGEMLPTLMHNPPVVVTVAGRAASGKTCLVVGQYLRIASGCPTVFPYRFCGSRTLRGFEQLSHAAFEWRGGADERIVPRTNLGSHREPAFLHLSFRRREGEGLAPEVTEVLLTDMPGEWFYRWSQDASYASHLPFLPRTDVFWVVVDAPRLITDRRADRDALDLLNRVLAEAADGRPVALILTQIDLVEVPPPERVMEPRAWGPLGRPLRRLLARLERHSGPTGFYPTSAFPGPGGAPPVGVIDPLRIALERPPPARPPPLPPASDRYFDQFREYVPQGAR